MTKAAATGDVGGMVRAVTTQLNKSAKQAGIHQQIQGGIVDDVAQGGEAFKTKLEAGGGNVNPWALMNETLDQLCRNISRI